MELTEKQKVFKKWSDDHNKVLDLLEGKVTSKEINGFCIIGVARLIRDAVIIENVSLEKSEDAIFGTLKQLVESDDVVFHDKGWKEKE